MPAQQCVTKLTATLPVDRSSAGIIQPGGWRKQSFEVHGGKIESLGLLCQPDCGFWSGVLVEGGLYACHPGHPRAFRNVRGKMRKRSCLPLLAPAHSLQGVHPPN